MRKISQVVDLLISNTLIYSSRQSELDREKRTAMIKNYANIPTKSLLVSSETEREF